MAERSAVDTIKGYFYQFDLSILTLLRLNSHNDSIEVECVEDIDIKTASEITATQCKYYSKTEYNHSVIKEAVMHMLSHFKEVKAGTKNRVKYAIRGHYSGGQQKLPRKIDVDFLKTNFFTYTSKNVKHFHHIEMGVTDEELEEFLSLLSIDVNSVDFDEQFKQIITEIENIFSCGAFSAEFFYYNNALSSIRRLATQPMAANRTVTKKDFLEEINTSEILFNEWFIEKRGKRAHFSTLRKEYFTYFNIPPHERFFLIEINPTSYVRDEIKDLIFIIARKWSKLSKYEAKPFCPYLFFHGISPEELIEIKKDIVAEGFKFSDGHDYYGASFDPKSITQTATHNNGIKLKIINSIENLASAINHATRTRKVYQFHLREKYFQTNNPSVGQINIQIENPLDIKSIV